MAFLSPAHPSRPGHTPYLPIPTGNRASSSPPAPPPAATMWRGGAIAASAARALRSRLIPDPIHHPATSLAPIASARASSSAPSAAAANNVVEEAAAAAVSVSQQAGSVSNALHHYGRCYWELSKARLRCAICFSCSPWIYCNVSWNSIRNKLRKHALVSCNQSCH